MKDSTQEFIDQVGDAGFDVVPYQGRAYWFGPSVHFSTQDELIELIRATDMPVQWDSPRFYPKEQDSKWYSEHEADEWPDEDEEEDE